MGHGFDVDVNVQRWHGLQGGLLLSGRAWGNRLDFAPGKAYI
jgi:hypothetical protein